MDVLWICGPPGAGSTVAWALFRAGDPATGYVDQPAGRTPADCVAALEAYLALP